MNKYKTELPSPEPIDIGVFKAGSSLGKSMANNWNTPSMPVPINHVLSQAPGQILYYPTPVDIPGVSMMNKTTQMLVIAVDQLPESIEIQGKDGAKLTLTRDEFAAKLGIEW